MAQVKAIANMTAISNGNSVKIVEEIWTETDRVVVFYLTFCRLRPSFRSLEGVAHFADFAAKRSASFPGAKLGTITP